MVGTIEHTIAMFIGHQKAAKLTNLCDALKRTIDTGNQLCFPSFVKLHPLWDLSRIGNGVNFENNRRKTPAVRITGQNSNSADRLTLPFIVQWERNRFLIGKCTNNDLVVNAVSHHKSTGAIID